MPDMILADLCKRMAKIDFAMMSTVTRDGSIASRPMSNNGDVEYDGDSWFFSYDSARSVSDIEEEPQVGLTFTGAAGLLGKPPIFIAIEGTAEIIRDKAAFAAHWIEELERWFDQGIDTPGMVMIKVHAERIHYWDGEDEGEVAM